MVHLFAWQVAVEEIGPGSRVDIAAFGAPSTAFVKNKRAMHVVTKLECLHAFAAMVLVPVSDAQEPKE